MREIKFRAWDISAKRMWRVTRIDWGHDDEFGMRVFVTDNDNCYWIFQPPHTESDGYELMQYTGLKDKNGKEIYEGDIVIPDRAPYCMGIDDGAPVTVTWLDCGGWYPFADDQDGMVYPDPAKSEVIENIYEHGDLLK